MPTIFDTSRRYIKDLGPNERVEGIFTINNAQLGKTRQDKPYLRCLISDKTGEVSGRMWSIEEALFRKLPTEGFVWLEGETQPYQGELQLIIHSIERTEPSAEQMRDLLPTTTGDIEAMFAEVATILGSLRHPGVRALGETYLEDEALMTAFRAAPAAKSMHHAYLGGLLEHTLNLLRLARAVCPLYPKLNQDLVLMGLFLHDLGKTRELAYDRAFGYTERGELIGHIVEGAIMLHDKSQQMMATKGLRLPPGALTVLQHIVLSHHGVPEYGAPKVPMTPEALLVSMLDNIDAKMAMAITAARPDEAKAYDLGGNFTERLWALDTKLYRPDPLGQ
ncbi:MAG: HD domain-containing protein [Phycisphaerales bacterium]|nr:HD domain-containing protein [Phycisphaerales bacterium]